MSKVHCIDCDLTGTKNKKNTEIKTFVKITLRLKCISGNEIFCGTPREYT